MSSSSEEKTQAMGKAERQMRRGLTALHLEVHESICATMTEYFDAALAEARAAAEARGRAYGVREGLTMAQAIAQAEADSPHLTLQEQGCCGYVAQYIRAALAKAPGAL